MELTNYISEKYIKIDTKSANKEELCSEIAMMSKSNPALSHQTENSIKNALLEREKINPTAFGNGIAIPHCSFDDCSSFVVGIIISKKGIDFNAIDGKKVHVFFFIIGPKEERNTHIQILSSISRMLQSKRFRDYIVKVKDKREVLDLLASHFNEKNITPPQNEKVIFHVFIQKEHYFDDILQIFSEVVSGSITVIESINAGYYLHKLPLFSSFWSDDEKQYSRLIIAVVDKKLSNNIIRLINTLVESIDNEPGVMITAQDLYYTNGCIDF